MDNQDKIKFKYHQSEGWFWKIDLESGAKISFPIKHGFYKEMMTWKAAGNKIEEQETPEETAGRLKDEAGQALESQKSECLRLLSDTDHKANGDWPYTADIPKWIEFRKQLRIILKSDKIEKIPDKPF
jgi:hypothetical protein